VVNLYNSSMSRLECLGTRERPRRAEARLSTVNLIDEGRMRSRRRQYFGLLLLIFLVFSAAISVAGYAYFNNQRRIFVQDREQEIKAIASLKVDEITWWLHERNSDTQYIFRGIFVADSIRRLMKNPSDTHTREDVLAWMETLKNDYEYRSVFLLDTGGSIRLSKPPSEPPPGDECRKLAAVAARERRVITIGLHRDSEGSPIFYDLLAPITDPTSKDAASVGVVLLRVDPYRVLYPLVQMWPSPSSSSDAVLVAREGNDVVFLSELRHRKGAALSFRVPLTQSTAPVVMAVQGRSGAVEGTDYRGVPVLAAISAIPGTPWFLVAKVDKSEVYQPLRERAQATVVLASLLVIALALGVGMLWRKRDAQFYRDQYEAELARKALSHHFQYLTKYANDIILLMDSEWNIVEANDRAVESYGYPREALVGLGLRTLYAREHLTDFDRLAAILQEQDGTMSETVHKTRAGLEFPVEASSRLIEIEGKRFYQTIIRDITERKRSEQALHESEREYRSLMEQALEGIILLDRRGIIRTVNKSACVISGFAAEEMVGRDIREVVAWEDNAAHSLQIERLLAEGMMVGEVRVRRRDEAWIAIEGTARVLDDGRLCLIFRDVTRHRQLEKEILDINLRLEQRIGRDLHDVLGQTLVAASFSVKHLIRKLGTAHPEEAADAVRLEQMLSDAIAQMRALAHGLCPIDFAPGGLVTALKDLAADSQTATGIPCSFNSEGDTTIGDQDVAMHAYLIAREALNNAIKHSTAKHVVIRLIGRADVITLLVADDGMGIRHNGQRTTGLGLQTMEYRANLIGASLQVQDSPSGGTMVFCNLARNSSLMSNPIR